MPDFQLRFSETKIQYWADRYSSNDQDEQEIERVLVPRVRKRGRLNKEDFLFVCRWKTPRQINNCRNNSDDFIQEVTALALGNSSERMRIEVLTLLDGVQWPTASVILHWFHNEPYPILDYRALWSLKTAVPAAYDFDFWSSYTAYCRSLAQRTHVSMRVLDRALWNYSKEKQ